MTNIYVTVILMFHNCKHTDLYLNIYLLNNKLLNTSWELRVTYIIM